MATNELAPRPSPAEARTALEGAAGARRAVQDLPWPAWLLVVNALGLGLLGLSPLAASGDAPGALAPFLVGGAIAAANVLVGMRLGAPWAVPSSRGFRVAFAVAWTLSLGTMLLALALGPAWPVFAGAAATTLVAAVAMGLQRRGAR
ncbi:hypothetical protein OVA14_13275 [Agrococcus sp. SL85]|uniref:hypothetical protein n=1 Tax=Agrococcus sp. SL85 TaxID=2995141 RepID=UPI00226C657D|nr:hypothetical protein [Agrococcus sp. SL85]WAC66218.1 hypothetical protein OVA14_13275 [Agrococcus sp. SL85]